MTAQIYALADPRTGDIRYIGKTSKALDERVSKHMIEARRNGGSYRLHWLRELARKQLRPISLLIDVVPEGQRWQEWEARWIAIGRDAGWPLTNGTAGGDGVVNPSPEERLRRSIAARGNTHASGKRSKEFRRRMSIVARQTKNALGHTVSKESRRGISENLRAYYAAGGPTMAGERNGHAKFTEQDVRNIRKKIADGGMSMRSIARSYSVSHETIRKIANRETWKHVTEG